MQTTTYQRAVACLCALIPMVLDDATDVADAQNEIRTMSAAEVMRELATWKSDAAVMPEWEKVLRAHNFV